MDEYVEIDDAIEPLDMRITHSAEDILAELPTIADADKPLVTRYVTMLNEWENLQSIRRREGLFASGANGQIVAHPVVKMINDAESKLLTMEDRLGMNPAARLRLGADKLRQKQAEKSLGSLLDELEE